jgi:hypothetical protein
VARGGIRDEDSAVAPTNRMACQSYLPLIDKRTRCIHIKRVIKSAGFTLTQLSAITADRYGRASPYFIPPTFLYKLAAAVTPSVCQIAALSVITSHRFTDWMTAFGFDLAQIPRLQVRLHRERTVLVTPFETDTNRVFSRTIANCPAARTSAPLRSAATPPDRTDEPYLYAKIGTADNPTFPELLPGSIVRVVTRNKGFASFSTDSNNGPIYLVERVGGLTCCRVKRLDDRHILLLSRQSAQSLFPLRLDEEARILGRVETELRPSQAPRVSAYTADSGMTTSLLRRTSENVPKLCSLLQIFRERSGLTFRSAHDLSTSVAQALHDKHYAISIGLLSDYETIDTPPRHTAKIMTLCILYGIDFFQYLNCADIQYDDSWKLPMPTTTCTQNSNQPLAWTTGQKRRTDFPLSLVEAQNEAIQSFSRRRMAV